MRTADSDVRPSARRPYSLRTRGDTWEDADRAARAMRTTRNTLVEQATEAALDYVRCHRGSCPVSPPIPLILADLRGRPLREWIADAVEIAESQHPDHGPVTVGKVPPAEVDLAVAFGDLQARMDEIQGRMSPVKAVRDPLQRARSRVPAAGSVPFMEPQQAVKR